MSTRVPRTRSSVGVCGLVAAALVSLTCGGGVGPEAVTGPEVASARAGAQGDVTVSGSGAPEFVDVCHYDAVTDTYSELTVPSPAVQPHLDHGDFQKPEAGYDCTQGPPPTAECTCFTAEDIDLHTQECANFDALCSSDSYSAYCLDSSGNLGAPFLQILFQGPPFGCASPSRIEFLSREEYDACLYELEKSAFVTEYPQQCSAAP